jgi:peptidoglycan/LPS O-acetylase OafA/YrhL
LVLVAYAQQPSAFEPPAPDDTFHDVLDVVGVAITLAFVVLFVAVSWPGVKRWARHRRRRRRRRQHDAHTGSPRLP